jgi:hypothetical protein
VQRGEERGERAPVAVAGCDGKTVKRYGVDVDTCFVTL